MRYFFLLLIFAAIACGDPTSENKHHCSPSISPEYYTDYDISNLDSVVWTGTSCTYLESLYPKSIKITSKKANAQGALWAFRLEDSIRTCGGQYLNFYGKNDTSVYVVSVSEMDSIVYLTEEQSLERILQKGK